jgi:hypothetical protein
VAVTAGSTVPDNLRVDPARTAGAGSRLASVQDEPEEPQRQRSHPDGFPVVAQTVMIQPGAL